MIDIKKLFKKLMFLLLNKNLKVNTCGLIKLLGISKASFYRHFTSKEDFFKKAFDFYLKPLINKRTLIPNRVDFDGIIITMNDNIYKKISKYDINSINFKINIEYYEKFLKDKYYRLMLHNIMSPIVFVGIKKVSTVLLLEEGYQELIKKILKLAK